MQGRPPLLSLEYFVATTREGTVRAAAERLHVTPSAVSHQISRLEEFLNTRLFFRHKRRLILTAAGKQYVEQVEAALDRIGNATRDVATRTRRRRLVDSVPPTFLAFWLLPRLNSLADKHQDLDLRFVDAVTIDLTRDDIDCGVEYRLHPISQLKSEKLFDDEVVPLASPSYIKNMRIRGLEDMRRCTLIHTERRPYSWSNVLRSYAWRSECRTLTVQYTYQALTSVALGHGVALANRRNAEYLLYLNQVVVAFRLKEAPRELPAYYFSYSPQSAHLETVRLFRNWIFSQRKRRSFVSDPR